MAGEFNRHENEVGCAGNFLHLSPGDKNRMHSYVDSNFLFLGCLLNCRVTTKAWKYLTYKAITKRAMKLYILLI